MAQLHLTQYFFSFFTEMPNTVTFFFDVLLREPVLSYLQLETQKNDFSAKKTNFVAL